MARSNSIGKADLVADYLLAYSSPASGDVMTNLKLQKLVYLAQGWHLGFYGKPIFEEEIQAWAHGPVCVHLYQRFKRYSWQAIPPMKAMTGANPVEELGETELHVIDETWRVYGQWSARQLEDKTHSHDPWKQAYSDRPQGSQCDEVITHESMQNYFHELAMQSNHKPSSQQDRKKREAAMKASRLQALRDDFRKLRDKLTEEHHVV